MRFCPVLPPDCLFSHFPTVHRQFESFRAANWFWGMTFYLRSRLDRFAHPNAQKGIIFLGFGMDEIKELVQSCGGVIVNIKSL